MIWSYLRSVVSRPAAEVMPGWGGTTTSGTSSIAATSAPCSGPAPPKATSEKSRGSRPFCTVFERMALAMFALTMVSTPSAASCLSMPSVSASAVSALVGPFRRKRHLAAEEVVRIQPAEHEVGVRHCRRASAPAVAGGAGLGARALGPHLEGAARVDPRDAAAACADGGDVDHRHQHRVAADPGIPCGGFVVVAVDHDADVGAGAAHVEGDKAPPPGVLRRPGAAQHTGGGP